jgi:hypothetical protein
VPPSRLRPDVPIWLDHIVLKAVARDPKQRFETAEELQLALERNQAAVWQIALAVSLLFNLLLMYWLAFLPRHGG